MEWKNEVSSEQFLLLFEGLLDGANRLCNLYAVGLSRIRVSALPDHYEKAYAASLGNTGQKIPDTIPVPGCGEAYPLKSLILADAGR